MSSLLKSLEDEDLLIQVICHLDHEDLPNLARVSKSIFKAVKKAKELHFDYLITPKRGLPFRPDSGLNHEEDSNPNLNNQDDETEPPGAPIQNRTAKRRLDLSNISRTLFL